MKAELRLEKFQGPLDLLLQLIEGQQLAITEVALAQVTEQFFQYLNHLGENRSEELADFLVVATKLVYLKSRELLPEVAPEEEEGPSLAEQLKIYKKYAEAGKYVAELWKRGRLAYQRIEPLQPPVGLVMPLNAEAGDLLASLRALIKRLRPLVALPQVSIDRAVSLKERISGILNLLKQWRQTTFQKLVAGSQSRTERIVSFLAVLELIKESRVGAEQKGPFQELVIKRN